MSRCGVLPLRPWSSLLGHDLPCALRATVAVTVLLSHRSPSHWKRLSGRLRLPRLELLPGSAITRAAAGALHGHDFIVAEGFLQRFRAELGEDGVKALHGAAAFPDVAPR